MFAVADTTKETSKQAIADLKGLGVRSVMLTGDNPATAHAIAKQVGIENVRANLLPQDKQKVVAELEGKAALMSLEAVRASAERRAVLARESRGFFEKSFRLGESDLPTRLRAELEAFEAERQAARSRLDADAAVSELRQALGLLPD